jgi:hypothetical protein
VLHAASEDHDVVFWRRHSRGTLDDVVELLEGIGRILMEVSARLDELVDLVKGTGDEGEFDS